MTSEFHNERSTRRAPSCASPLSKRFIQHVILFPAVPFFIFGKLCVQNVFETPLKRRTRQTRGTLLAA